MLVTVTTVAPIIMMTSPMAAKRRQARSNTQKPGQDETDRAEHFAHADKAQEECWKLRRLLRQLIERKHQLHPTGEQKHQRQQSLKDPQRDVQVRTAVCALAR